MKDTLKNDLQSLSSALFPRPCIPRNTSTSEALHTTSTFPPVVPFNKNTPRTQSWGGRLETPHESQVHPLLKGIPFADSAVTARPQLQCLLRTQHSKPIQGNSRPPSPWQLQTADSRQQDWLHPSPPRPISTGELQNSHTHLSPHVTLSSSPHPASHSPQEIIRSKCVPSKHIQCSFL